MNGGLTLRLGTAMEERAHAAQSAKDKLQKELSQLSSDVAALETERANKQKQIDETESQKRVFEEQRQQVPLTAPFFSSALSSQAAYYASLLKRWRRRRSKLAPPSQRLTSGPNSSRSRSSSAQRLPFHHDRAQPLCRRILVDGAPPRFPPAHPNPSTVGLSRFSTASIRLTRLNRPNDSVKPSGELGQQIGRSAAAASGIVLLLPDR